MRMQSGAFVPEYLLFFFFHLLISFILSYFFSLFVPRPSLALCTPPKNGERSDLLFLVLSKIENRDRKGSYVTIAIR